jgi:hypothetical protein
MAPSRRHFFTRPASLANSPKENLAPHQDFISQNRITFRIVKYTV